MALQNRIAARVAESCFESGVANRCRSLRTDETGRACVRLRLNPALQPIGIRLSAGGARAACYAIDILLGMVPSVSFLSGQLALLSEQPRKISVADTY